MASETEHLCPVPGTSPALVNIWEFYQGKTGRWRWRVTSHENGKILGASSQSYANHSDLVSNARRMGYTGPDPT